MPYYKNVKKLELLEYRKLSSTLPYKDYDGDPGKLCKIETCSEDPIPAPIHILQ
jgi:hypothetical protein